jgi:sulfatase maturation enzyme AslB (radical SAM superfamily)
MSKATAKKVVDLIFKSPSPAIKIEFQGGEPLLNFTIVRYIVESGYSIDSTWRKR